MEDSRYKLCREYGRAVKHHVEQCSCSQDQFLFKDDLQLRAPKKKGKYQLLLNTVQLKWQIIQPPQLIPDRLFTIFKMHSLVKNGFQTLQKHSAIHNISTKICFLAITDYQKTFTTMSMIMAPMKDQEMQMRENVDSKE